MNLHAFLVSLVLCAAAASQVVTYHDQSAAAHQTQFTALSGQGYRLSQLSVAGGLSAPRYSAIWEQASGPAWVSMHNLTPAQYVTQRSTWLGQGYRPKLITAAGTGANAVIATVFVADGQSFADYLGITETTFVSHCNTQRANGRRPASVDIYGDNVNPLYSVVFEPNSDDTVWGYVIDADPTEFTETFNAFYEADARIAALGMSEDQRYVSVWHDDRVGAWAARSNYTTSGWQTQVNTLTTLGYSPLVLASGGTGASLRFAGAFAQYRTPRSRVFTSTGLSRSEFAAFHSYLTNHVQTTGARNASIAIAKNGRLVYARGYTWGESGTAITQPTSLFRIASVSKVPTAMAIQKLVGNGALSLSSRPATLLGVSGNTNWGNVTLQQCIEYTSGLPRDFNHLGAAQFANPVGWTLPVTLPQAVNWTAAQSALFTAGNFGNYCNTSFLVAGRVVEHVTGMPLQTWLQSNVYGPLGITRMRIAAGLPGNLQPDELRGYTTSLGLYPSVFYTDQRRKAAQWSGNPQLANASGGLAASTVDSVRLLAGVFGLGADWITHASIQQSSMLARHTVAPFPIGVDGLDQVTPGAFSWQTLANGVHAYNKSGTLSDASTRVIWRSDGTAIAVYVNKGDAWADGTTLNQLADAVTNWPNDDLFPTYGLPSFPRRPALTSVNVAVLQNVTNTPFVVTGERLDTVTAVNLGSQVILNTTTANWHLGWFRVLSPTQLEVYPPQGLAPASMGLSVSNTVGTSSGLFVAIQGTSGSVAVAAPPTVTPVQAFRVYCGSGPLPALSFGVLTISTSNTPSVAPGVVSLGIGAQFTDLLVTDFQLFDPTSRSAWWQLPALPWPGIWVQTAAIDFGSVSPLPLPTSQPRQVLRQ